MTPTLRHLAVPLVAVAALSTAACSGTASHDTGSAAVSGGSNGTASMAEPAAPAGAPTALGKTDAAVRTAQNPLQTHVTLAEFTQQRAVIQTGSVSLTSPDVARARFEVQKVVDDHQGLIDDENTVTDKHGTVRMSRLVVRVPTAEFDAAMTQLAKVGTLVQQTRKAEDVTTQLIDTRVRIKAQQASVDRIQALLAQAQSIRDIVAIEAQLTQRQADLDSLEQTQAYLQDQTSLSTITVYLERSHTPAAPARRAHHNPFVAGLITGWDAFTDLGAGFARAGGAALPFLGLFALLAWPLWLLVRRLAALPRRTTASEPTPTEA